MENKNIRIIGHLDMDAFFAAVEEKDNPWMKGKPIAVGSDPLEGRGRGVVSTANYKAREYGIRSATPISVAWRLSEQAGRAGKPLVVFVQPNFKRYSEESEKVMEVLKRYSPLIEQASIDEAYFDLSGVGSFEKAAEIAQEIKKEISGKQQLTASIGIGPNKLIAKIASDFQKPDGLTVIQESAVEKFLELMGVRKIPGIGPKTQELLLKSGIEKIQDLKKYTQTELEEILGKFGTKLYEKIRGRDEAPLETESAAKSIGEQETFFTDTLEPGTIAGLIKSLCQGVYQRFRKSGNKSFRTIVLTVRFSDFETRTRSHTLKNRARDGKTLEFEALRLLFPFLQGSENPCRKKIRLLGVRIEKLR